MGVRVMLAAMIAALLALPVLAAGIEGVWRTGPDGKGQTANVTALRCGDAFCGTITEIFAPDGSSIEHRNLGRRVFWDMRATGKATYEGRAFVPILGRDFPGHVTISGERLTVEGCSGPICKRQVWTRVR